MNSQFGAPTLPRDILDFLDELRDRFGVEAANQWKSSFEAIDREGDEKPDAVKALQAFGIIVSRPRPFRERLDALCDILMLPPGKVTVNVKLGAD
jgi:hypothetical protein